MTRVVGLDLSLAGTGVAAWSAGGRPELWTLATKPGPTLPRLQWLRAQVSAVVRGADLVVMEGLLPAGAAKEAGKQNERAALFWFVADRLHALRVPYAVADPSALKMYALGRGAGKGTTKAAVVGAVVR